MKGMMESHSAEDMTPLLVCWFNLGSALDGTVPAMTSLPHRRIESDAGAMSVVTCCFLPTFRA